MIRFNNYVKAESLEEAYELNRKKTSVILGGMLWLKMQDRSYHTAIDLSGLGLDTIEETEEEFCIGCMTTLRQIELHEGLSSYTHGAAREAVRHIVGVQFRNLATVGGSLFGRYGFSDVLTFFLALDTTVELYHGGMVSLEEFASMNYDRDLLVRIHVKKTPCRIAYQTMRNTKTDFPVLACCMASMDGEIRAAIGARPGRAKLFRGDATPGDLSVFAAKVQEECPLGTNMLASEEYRRHLVGVLIRRCGKAMAEQEDEV